MIDAAANIPEIRKGNKAQAAQFFDITLPTLERWLREGAPVVQRGSRGISWILDLRQTAQWKYGSNIGPGGIDPDSLSPQDRKAWYDSEQKRRALQVQDRELIPVAEIERVISTAFSAIVQGLRSLPDNIERRTGCSPEIVEAIEWAIDAETEALAEKLAALGPVDE